jgi:hypothetical protein
MFVKCRNRTGLPHTDVEDDGTEEIGGLERISTPLGILKIR